jgi:phage terminase large subunit-like protein
VPTKLNNFLTKRLNVWTDSQTRWISTDKWNASFRYEIDETQLKGAVCFGGLDLSSTTDITALVWLFPQNDGNDEWYDVLCRFWIPEENMRERVRRDKVPYDVWIREGWIQTTPGDVIDYDFIEEQIKRDYSQFKVKELAYDRWNATSIINNLMNEGIENLVPFGQGFASMSAPTKELEMLVLRKKLNHGNNPVLKWMMSNVI